MLRHLEHRFRLLEDFKGRKSSDDAVSFHGCGNNALDEVDYVPGIASFTAIVVGIVRDL